MYFTVNPGAFMPNAFFFAFFYAMISMQKKQSGGVNRRLPNKEKENGT
jgi:hypothetical protein